MVTNFKRQKFLQYTAMAGAAVLLSSLEGLCIENKADKKLRVAVIGCGSVSNSVYSSSADPHHLIELVSVCDIKYRKGCCTE